MVTLPYIFQIVGYQNSGKTTFITKLIEQLSEKGIKVGTIKHHGHGGKPDINEQKDSARHIFSGAFVSLVEGDGRLIVHAEKPTWGLSEKIKVLSTFNLDVIIIEGHKYEDYPKAVIVTRNEDLMLIEELRNIEMLLFRGNIKFIPHTSMHPIYHLDNLEGLEAVITHIEEQLNK